MLCHLAAAVEFINTGFRDAMDVLKDHDGSAAARWTRECTPTMWSPPIPCMAWAWSSTADRRPTDSATGRWPDRRSYRPPPLSRSG